ncbi:MAG: HPr kinase/phosphatase C-terminal domain-containing protein [Hyphomicrobiaceae bacterium]|nr:HPr kinase/phosphatase C-terminal domain-containing protein [Hyphomicrobiaceae bacterium]
MHGTAIALAGRAALIRGASGSGKSDLALRCLAQPATGLISAQPLLIADDQVLVESRGGSLLLSCPAAIRGLMEVRGLGVVAVPMQERAELALLVDLVIASEVERLPDANATADLLGVPIRRLALSAFEASAPLKLLLALQGAAVDGQTDR